MIEFVDGLQEKTLADVGLIGLAVMGQNLTLNMADHEFKVAVFNRTTQVTKDFVAANPDTPGGLVGCEKLPDFVIALKKPRKIVILVKAGPAVDTVVKQLIEAGIDKDDLIVDCGNSRWTDTIRREREYSGRCQFFGSGVSGGEASSGRTTVGRCWAGSAEWSVMGASFPIQAGAATSGTNISALVSEPWRHFRR